MRVSPNRKRRGAAGFGLFELVVNLGLIASTMVMIATLVTWATGTVAETSGKLAAAEKSEAVRKALAADLARVPAMDDIGEVLSCEASDSEWRLDLRLPRRGPGWTTVSYQWSRERGVITRSDSGDEESNGRVIGTGFSRLDSRWLRTPAGDPEDAPRGWSGGDLPFSLALRVETTDFREEGERGKPRAAQVATSAADFQLPVGGGTAAR